MYALSSLELLGEAEVAHEALLAKITAWCSDSVQSLKQEIEEHGLDDAGTRWDLVEALIRDERVAHRSFGMS